MGSELETIEARIRCMLVQLKSECGILQRVVYKNKNQHRRCSYFQRLLNVSRDLRLLMQSANLEDLVTSSCFLLIKGEDNLLEISLKRRRIMERLLGAARLLAEMVEPILKASTEVSVLFARTFFMGFSLTVMALLARVRVLVQQLLLDVVSLFNIMVSSRELYPVTVSEDFVILELECVWKLDKFILLERKQKRTDLLTVCSEEAKEGE